MPVETIRWSDGELTIIDQTRLPRECTRITLHTLDEVWNAIKTLQVRGAPAIGVCAAFGVVVGIKDSGAEDTPAITQAAHDAAAHLATSRPTAVNLFWALDRMKATAGALAPTLSPGEALEALEQEAIDILEEDRRLCRAIGEHGASLIHDGAGVLTHCNAGALATSGCGTALAVMYVAAEQGRSFRVFADETRPLLQGARLTAWELDQAGLDVTLICDNMAAQVMREGKISLVITGADRIAANGDAVNKIGTYGVAQLARVHDIPFYIAAPSSTFDLTLESGDGIPIEQRDPAEISEGFGLQTAPEGVKIYNPAFDLTPAGLIAGIITEHGILEAPYSESIAARIGKLAAP